MDHRTFSLNDVSWTLRISTYIFSSFLSKTASYFHWWMCYNLTIFLLTDLLDAPSYFVIINKSAMNIHTLTQLRAHIFLQTSASRFVWEILKSGRASSKDKYILWAASKLASKTAVIHTSTRSSFPISFILANGFHLILSDIEYIFMCS